MPLTVTFQNVDNSRRSLSDLQLFLVFCHLSAQSGRVQSQTAYKRMIEYMDKYVGGAGKMPFEIIKKIIDDGKLGHFVTKGVKCGAPELNKKFFKSIINNTELDLRHVGRDELAKKINGLSLTRASMFLLFRDNKWTGAMLDRRVKNWMKDQFNEQGHPDKAASIPENPIRSKAQYEKTERDFLALAKKQGMTPKDLNLSILRQSKRTKYDRADEDRVIHGGKPYTSHWASRMSREDISLEV